MPKEYRRSELWLGGIHLHAVKSTSFISASPRLTFSFPLNKIQPWSMYASSRSLVKRLYASFKAKQWWLWKNSLHLSIHPNSGHPGSRTKGGIIMRRSRQEQVDEKLFGTEESRARRPSEELQEQLVVL